MKIIFKTNVVFRDWNGTVTRVYKRGEIINYTTKNKYYYVTSYGGIWFDEVEEVLNENY